MDAGDPRNKSKGKPRHDNRNECWRMVPTQSADNAAVAPASPPSPPPRSGMDRFIDTIEWVAAFFVGIVAANIFIAVLLRNLFSVAIPDAFDIGRLLLGILIFWGIAATSYRGGHITVDLVWANVAPRWQRAIDVFATLVLLFVVSVQTYTLFDKVRGTYYDHVLTFDLRLPTWPFFAVAWAGDVSAVILIAIRTWRLVFQPEKLAGEDVIAPAKAVE